MIFQEIEQAHKGITGWCSWERAQTLASIVIATRPEISAEIGVWAGKSFIPMAMAHKQIGFGMAWAIDSWKNEASIAGQINPEDVEWWSHQNRHDYAYNQFQETIVKLGLQNATKIIRAASDEVEPPQNIGLLSLDGNHGEQAIRDVRRFAVNIKPGGFLILDDLGWSGGSVMNSLQLAITLGFKELYRCQDKETQNHWSVLQRL